MPDWSQLRGGSAPQQPAQRRPGSIWGDMGSGAVAEPVDQVDVAVEDAESADTGPSFGAQAATAGVGAGILGGIAMLARRNPGGLSKIAGGLNALRQQLMLSGFAVPKSLLGNVGAGVERAVEGKGTGALREMFSRQTLDDAISAYKAGSSVGPKGTTLPGPTPGRVMDALDTASRQALMRGGASADEATNAVLQSPLSENLGKLGDALDSPTARYIHPFRRTPFNQFVEGWKKVKAAHEGDAAARRGLAIYGTAGAAHGAATADDETPISVPLAIAGSARYGLPYGLAVLAGRTLAGGKTTGSGAAGSILPVSEYGVESAFDPTRPFEKPAALTALERLFQ